MRFPSVGEVFEEKYELIDELGRGGFAAVYRARDVDIGRMVALKVLVPHEDGTYDESLVARFHREARVVAQLADPHSITMYDFGRTEDGLLFMAFEYVAGQDLSDALKENGPLHPTVVVHIARQVLEALREAHAAGVLHRDIKPANVLVYSYMDDDWQVKLLDFGIAKPGVGRNADPVATITQAGGVVGTPRYMSQEQLCGEELAPSTDIYSLGLVAYELLVGWPAIAGRDTRENLALQLSPDRLEFPASTPVPQGLKVVVERMIERDAANRYQSADDAIAALDSLGAQTWSGPVSAPQPPPRLVGSGPQPPIRPRVVTESTQSRPKSLRLSPAVLTVIGLAIGALVALGIVAIRKPRSPPPVPKQRPIRPVIQVRPISDAAPAQGARAAMPDADSSDSGSDAGTVTPGASGCGKPMVTGTTHPEIKVGAMGSNRKFLRMIPKSYDPDLPHPLLVIFHDKTRSPLSAIQDTEMATLAEKHGFVIVAPEGAWMPPFKPSDVNFAVALVEDTVSTVCIDPSRIYGLGHFEGGQAVEMFLCDLPFAAIATTSWRGSERLVCEPEVPIPYLHLVGDQDLYQPVDGGAPCDSWFTKAKPVPPLAVKDQLWEHANRCEGERKVVSKTAAGTCWTRESCVAPYISCLWKGGRDWPASTKRTIEMGTCRGATTKFPVAKTVWKFLSEHRRPEP